ncbi:hypothetical protein [Sphingobacterium sp. MYb388]|uniref:hypothetical protein n=1 Tax=Sphingobacterium sp. MYb388 TaxID=2745437 RepID=UPI003094D73C
MFVELTPLRKLMKPLKGDPKKKSYYKKLFKWHAKLIKARQQICFNLEAHLYKLQDNRKKGIVYYDGYTLALIKLERFGKKKLSAAQKVYLTDCIETVAIFMENQYTYLYLLNGMTLFEIPFGKMEAKEIENIIL